MQAYNKPAIIVEYFNSTIPAVDMIWTIWLENNLRVDVHKILVSIA